MKRKAKNIDYCFDCHSILKHIRIGEITERVICPKCGVKWEIVDWAKLKGQDFIGGND